MRIALDVGGTFTDAVIADEKTGSFFCIKTPTTHDDLTRGVLSAIEEILKLSGECGRQIDYVIHGTTIGTNAIIEGKGAKTALITTSGFEDVLEIRRVARPKEAAFDFGADNPPPLVPRYLRKGVRERIKSTGEIFIPLDESSVIEALEDLNRHSIEAIVVSLLFSFLNPVHEQRVAALCRQIMPTIPITLSSDICPEFREYERTCTAVMNGYLSPVIEQYLKTLEDALENRFGSMTIHIMQSNGGSMSIESARRHAAHLINSGPAGGAIAAAFISRLTGNEMAVGADMGGTTFDISIIDRGMPKTTTWGGITHYPVKLPMVDLKTIGAGGGSIAWVDAGGALHVGPQSAGSNPGPACYGWNGILPTVSDANLVLGRLNPRYFLGGKLPLYPDAAKEAIRKHVAEKMNLSVEKAAFGIIRIVNANMAKGISGNSVEKGYDLREFALISMGGAAALHAVDLARELNMACVIIPPMSGNFSAIGLAVANIQRDYVRTFGRKAGLADPSELETLFHAMETEGIEALLKERVIRESMVSLWSADMRYEGQSWELNIPVEPFPKMSDFHIREISERFHQIHRQIYSYAEPRENVEFVNLRVRLIGKNSALSLPRRIPGEPPGRIFEKEMRNVWFEAIGWDRIPIFERASLMAGSVVPGPCIIEEPICTILIPHGFAGTIDAFSNILIPISQKKIRPDRISGEGGVTE